MTTAVIADDEPHLARALQTQLAALWPGLQVVATPRNGVEAAAAIARHRPDLAFLDIQMPGLTGLEVAQGIEGRTRVIFVTAYDAYAVQAFEQEAIDYLLKPVHNERLQRCLDRVRRALHAGDGDSGPAHRQDVGRAAEGATATDTDTDIDDSPRLLAALQRLLPAAAHPPERLRWVRASKGDLTQQIAVEDVLFFQADEKYTCVRTRLGESLIRTPVAELAAQLDPAVFWQVHRSTIVNLAHLEGTRRDDTSRLFVRIKGHPQELPVSRAYVHLFKAM